jgi:short-subunit dehydrogenase
MSDFNRKYGPWALVVGASEGLGACFAAECAARGLNVGLVARRQDALDEVAGKIRERYGIATRQIVADAGAPDFIAAVQAGMAGLEIGFLIYNAAAEPGGPFLKIRLDDHLNNIQVNCVAPTQLVYWLGAEMSARRRGGIVLISSSGAFSGLAHWASYAAAKSYELILGEGLWDEFRDSGVLATSYVVGSTATPNFKRIQKKLGLPFAADNLDPADFPPGTPFPRTPEENAAALFAQLEDGPRLYCHEDEEKTFKEAAAANRRDWIAARGVSLKAFFTGGLNELDG